MGLQGLGEFGLIDLIKEKVGELPEDVVRGIGDDCSVVKQPDGSLLLVTTDTMVAGVHFLRDRISAEDLGYKLLAVSLSDVAAMGGRPCAAYLSGSMPKDTDPEWVMQLVKGFTSHGIPLLGGDTTHSEQMMLVSTVVGRGKPGCVKLRSGVKPGDVVCVTGTLGDSGGGLQLLLDDQKMTYNDDEKQLIEAHNRPRPHLEEGTWLGNHSAVHAMIDVSDGLVSDLAHLSPVGFEIDLDLLPISPQLRAAFSNPTPLASSAGEDYCLLVTIDQIAFPTLSADFLSHFGRPLHPIGHATKDGSITYHQAGKVVDPASGYDHFKK